MRLHTCVWSLRSSPHFWISDSVAAGRSACTTAPPDHVSTLSLSSERWDHVRRGAAYREYSLDGLEPAPAGRDASRSLDAVHARPCGTLRPRWQQAVRCTMRARVTPRLVNIHEFRHL